MLSVFSLTNALNEAVNVGGSVDVDAYNFIGDLDESTFLEANHEIMSEAAAFSEFVTLSDEAMVEAAIGGTLSESQQVTLSENVFKQIMDGIKKFIDKIIAMVKGLINKLKAFFYKFTGKTSKWVGIMKEPIKKARSRKGASDFKYSMHEWNRDYVLTKMSAGATSLVSSSLKESGSAFSGIVDINVQSANEFAKYKDNPQDDAVKRQITTNDNVIEQVKTRTEKYDEDFVKTLAKALSVSADNTDAVWREVEKLANGGEKSEVAIYSSIDAMLNTIDGSKKTIDNLKKLYEEHLKQLTDIRSKLDKLDKDLSNIDKNVPDNIASSYRSLVSAKFDAFKHELSTVESALNTAQSKNLKYVQSMVSEYMSALSKFSGIKDKKD